MRFDRIEIDSFGVLHNAVFELDAPFVLFYGPNEAGKSTTLAFFRAMLFGMPPRTSIHERYEPSQGGTYGGKLFVANDRGDKIRVSRHFQTASSGARHRGSGTIKVSLNGEEALLGGDELLKPLLGGVTPELFRSLFAFGLTELQELRSLQTDEISSYLFRAGMGSDGIAVAHAEKAVIQALEELYKPKGSKQPVNRLLNELEETEAELRKSRGSLARYAEIVEETIQVEDLIAKDQGRLDQIKGSIQLYAKGVQAWEHAVRQRELELELTELTEQPGFPEDAELRYDAWVEEHERLQTELGAKQQRKERLLLENEAVPVDEHLLKRKPELDRLSEQWSVYEAGRKQQLEMEQELDGLQKQLDRLLQELGVGWTESELLRFSGVVVMHEELREHAERLRLAEKERERAEEEILRHERQRDQMERECENLRSAIEEEERSIRHTYPWLVPPSLSEALELWKNVQKELAQHEKYFAEQSHWSNMRSQALESEQQRVRFEQEWNLRETELQASSGSGARISGKLRLPRTLLTAGLFSNVLGPLLVYVISGEWFTPAVLAAALLVMNALLLYAVRRPSSSAGAYSDSGARGPRAADRAAAFAPAAPQPQVPAAVQQAERRLAELAPLLQRHERRLQQLAEALLTGGEAAAAAAHGANAATPAGSGNARAANAAAGAFGAGGLAPRELASLEPAFRALEPLARRTEQLRERERLLQERLRAHLQDLAPLRRQAEASQRQAEASRQLWSSWLLKRQFAAELSPAGAQEALRLVEKAKDLLQAKNRLAQKAEGFQRQEDAYLQQCEELLGLTGLTMEDSSPQLARLRERIEEQWKRKENLQERETAIQRLEEEGLELSEKVKSVLGKLNLLLSEVKAEDGNELRKKAHTQLRRRQLQAEIRHLQALLESIAGSIPLEQLSRLLKENDQQQLRKGMQDAERQAAELESELNERRIHLGKLLQEMDSLKQGNEHSDRLLRQQELTAEVNQLVHRYAALSLCSELFRGAKTIYERERQPAVMQRASVYFRYVTEGRYVKLFAPIDGSQLMVTTQEGETLNTSQLSRGTAEQLYLAIRFALAAEVAEQRGMTMPFILDDIAVNFDGRRLEKTLELLAGISKLHQIVFFTCHEHVREAAERIVPRQRTITLV